MPPENGNIFCNCSILNGSPNLRIKSDGSVFACEKANDSFFSLGSLNQSHDDYYNRMKVLRAKLTARIIRMSTEECGNCIYNYTCNKGCPIFLTSVNNNPYCVEGRVQHV